MSYQIQYNKTGMQIDLSEDAVRTKRPVPWKIIALIAAILCVYALNVSVIRDFFIPGDKQITKAAFQELDQSLKDGQPFTQAFYEFCREVVQKDDIT